MTTYKDSGVDISAADDAKDAMRKSVDVGDPRVINTFGAFASLVKGTFPGYEDPVLALKTEEPGSKQKIAFTNGFVRSICFDTINHLVNDIAVMGASPLYVQDLIICGKMEKKIVTQIVEGFAAACKEQECVLTGGETTEQPGVLPPGTYALAANIVGIVERKNIIDGSKIRNGDTVIGIASNGLHTNGYTLVRVLLDKDPTLAKKDTGGTPFLDAVMEPHTCYFQALRGIFLNTGLHGLAHITGGGIQGNVNRILPKGLSAKINLPSIEIPPVFTMIRDAGNVEDREMLRTYNMGVGIVAVVAPEEADAVTAHLKKAGHRSFRIGEIIAGNQTVVFESRLRW